MSKVKLTEALVERQNPVPGKRLEIPDAGCPGLVLRIGETGKRSWTVAYRVAGRGEDGKRGSMRRMGLGPYPTVGLKDAREAARRVIEQADRGTDPALERQAEARAKSARDVETVVERFLEDHVRPHLVNARDAERLLVERVVPVWRGRDIATIGRADVHALLDDVKRAGSPALAREVRKHLSKMFSWAADRGIIPVSPVALMLRKDLVGKPRDRVLSMEELREVWDAAGKMGYPFGPHARLLILTALRLKQVGSMERSWLAPDGRSLEIPAEADKTGTASVTPLSEPAQRIIAGLPIWNLGDYVFSTKGGEKEISGYSKSKARLDKLIAKAREEAGIEETMPPWKYHDLRRSVATHLARMGTPQELIERILNHKIPGIAGVYNRYSYLDEKRAVIEKWGELWK